MKGFKYKIKEMAYSFKFHLKWSLKWRLIVLCIVLEV